MKGANVLSVIASVTTPSTHTHKYTQTLSLNTLQELLIEQVSKSAGTKQPPLKKTLYY